MSIGYENFAWPATGDLAAPPLSTWDGGPVLPGTGAPAGTGRSRHAAAIPTGPDPTALLRAGRRAVADWVRRTGAPTGRHALERYVPGPALGRHSAVANTGYLPVVVSAPLPYRGRRRAEAFSEWRWPALAGSVAGASLAFTVLLVAASPQAAHRTSDSPGAPGVTALGHGQLIPAPPACAGGDHAAGGNCRHGTATGSTGSARHLAAARPAPTGGQHRAGATTPAAHTPLPFTPTPFGPPPFISPPFTSPPFVPAALNPSTSGIAAFTAATAGASTVSPGGSWSGGSWSGGTWSGGSWSGGYAWGGQSWGTHSQGAHSRGAHSRGAHSGAGHSWIGQSWGGGHHWHR
jgi:hypothetical protein